MKGLLSLILGSTSIASIALIGIPAQQAQASDALIAQLFPFKIYQQEPPVRIRIPHGHSAASQSIVLNNEVEDWITYELNGQRFQLRKGESRSHRVNSEDSPEVKFDQFNLGGGWSNQPTTRSLIPGRSYTFKRSGGAQVELY